MLSAKQNRGGGGGGGAPDEKGHLMEKGNKRRGSPDSKRAPGEREGHTGLTKGTGRKRERRTALYRKFETYIPRNETARLCSQFLHSCICERFKYSHDLSSADRWWEYIKGSQIRECGKWETEHYNSVLEITRPRSFTSGNT
jgi:hypothetical protein